jgi:hypothetical protein
MTAAKFEAGAHYRKRAQIAEPETLLNAVFLWLNAATVKKGAECVESRC